MANPIVQNIDGGVVFSVKVVAGASKTCMAGRWGDAIKVKVAAARQKGKANRCLVKFLASQLNVKQKDVEIVKGQFSTVKRILVQGLSSGQFYKKVDLGHKD
ncbi:MAG: YggU family protein [Sedimentisphaerales bacterium]|nr:YggU family protein [Sedimentisphaerales bacterium]